MWNRYSDEELHRRIDTLIMRGLSATDARQEAEREQAVSARPLQTLDGCTCGGIGDTGSHYANCLWSMRG